MIVVELPAAPIYPEPVLTYPIINSEAEVLEDIFLLPSHNNA